MAQCTFAPKLVSEQIAPEGRIMRVGSARLGLRINTLHHDRMGPWRPLETEFDAQTASFRERRNVDSDSVLLQACSDLSGVPGALV